MAGVKGRSGGFRLGAGRKPKALPPPDVAESPLPVTDEPLSFLLAVQNSSSVDIKTRVRAAIAAAQYKHTKRGDGGIKDDVLRAAKTAGQGKYKAAPSPLKLVNR